jgi:hypothetical protein
MTDIAANTANEPTPPPPVDSDAPDVISRGVPDAISGGSDDERIKESVKALNAQRQREWEQGLHGDDLGTLEEPTIARQKLPLWERKYPAGVDEPKTLREAAHEVSQARRLERPDAEIARSLGAPDQDILARAKDPDFVRQIMPHWTPGEVNHFVKTGESPPDKIGVFDERKGLREPIRDHERIFDLKTDEVFRNPRDATRQQGNWREVAELTRQEMAKQEAEALAIAQQQASSPTEAA